MVTSRDDLIDDLHRVNIQTDEDYPTTAAIREHGEYSLTVYYRVFDGIGEALEAAGIEKTSQPSHNSTTREELIGELQRLAEEQGDTPTIEDMDESGAFSGATYYNHFESWNTALREAGLETNHVANISREDLIQDIQAVDEATDGPHPTVESIREHATYSITTYISEFGGLENVLGAAGIERVDQSITKDEIVSEIRRLATGGYPPTVSEMDESGQMSSRTCTDRFGSWNAAVRAAGFEPNVDAEDGDHDDLLEEIERLNEETLGTPTVRDMRDHGKYTPSRYFNNFESWNDAIREIGLEPNEQVMDPVDQRIPESDLLEELRDVAGQVGDRPTAEDMLNHGKYTTKPYYNRFGSWNRAVELAGYTPFTGTSEDIYSTEELLTELQRLADELGHPPTTTEMAEHGRISTQPYFERFDSWIVALRQADIEPTERQLRRYSAVSE